MVAFCNIWDKALKARGQDTGGRFIKVYYKELGQNFESLSTPVTFFFDKMLIYTRKWMFVLQKLGEATVFQEAQKKYKSLIETWWGSIRHKVITHEWTIAKAGLWSSFCVGAQEESPECIDQPV